MPNLVQSQFVKVHAWEVSFIQTGVETNYVKYSTNLLNLHQQIKKIQDDQHLPAKNQAKNDVNEFHNHATTF
jgi:hypothetical protein